jgi:HD superfamily phosphohydrolase
VSIHWRDRVYGESVVDDPGIVALIGTPTFQRLKGVRQAGPSALAFPFKNVSRYEHSLGVFLLLRRLGAPRKEQVAGLLHDISHTAFSHAIDFVHASEEQAHHEDIKPLFLERTDLRRAIEDLGYSPRAFYDDSIYGLLERPIPWLCADRLDYFLRDGMACEVVNAAQASRILSSACVVDGLIAMADREVAELARDLFAEMNRDWWASPTEAYIYNEFGQVLRLAMDRGILRDEDLLGEDDQVLELLRSSGDRELVGRLGRVLKFEPEFLEGYDPVIIPKARWLDPPVRVGDRAVPLSVLEDASAGVGG